MHCSQQLCIQLVIVNETINIGQQKIIILEIVRV